MEIPVHIDNYCYCDGCLRSSHANAEKGEYVPFEVLGVAVCVEGRKIYVYGVEHQFGAYEQRYKVASGEESEYSDEEEYGRQNKHIFSRDVHIDVKCEN